MPQPTNSNTITMVRSISTKDYNHIKQESERSDIYLITSPSGKIYVGQTHRAVYTDKTKKLWGAMERWKAHVRAALYRLKRGKDGDGCRLLNEEIRTYRSQLDKFNLEVLEICDLKDTENSEIKWIAQLKAQHEENENGLNVLKGGNSVGKHPKETCDRRSESIKKQHQQRTPDAYDTFRTDENREYAAKLQREKRICIHHDNITTLPYELQFKYQPGQKEGSFKVGYWITNTSGGIITRATVKRDFNLSLLDKKFKEALDVFCELYPNRSDEVNHLYGMVTEGKFNIEQMKTVWYIEPSKQEGVEPKHRNKNVSFTQSKKAFDGIKKTYMNKSDHLDKHLPMCIVPKGRKKITGYKVCRHPLLREKTFLNEYDLDNALQDAINYTLNPNDDDFLDTPLITYDIHFNDLPITKDLLTRFMTLRKDFKINIFRPGAEQCESS
jgi:hypothetical protein